MERASSRMVAAALAWGMLVLPGALSAGERRGANVLLALKDGHTLAGELIAVKPDSLILIAPTGKDESVGLADIAVITIVRKSKAWQGCLIGFVPGAVGGAIWGYRQADDDMAGRASAAYGMIFGALTGLIGLAIGAGAGTDTEIAFSGLPDEERDRVLAKLDGQARMPGAWLPKPGTPAAGDREGKATRPALAQKRFKLSWLPGFRDGGEEYSFDQGIVPFRFTEAVPPGEEGPFPSEYYSTHISRPTFFLGRLTMAYGLSRKLAAEIEANFSSQTTDHLVDLQFSSTVDGLEYAGGFGNHESVNSTSILFGLSFKLLPPATLQPHAIEISAAAGPAWVRTAAFEWSSAEDRTTVDRATKLTARLRASYDYHFTPAISMGAYAEYRWLRADVPSYALNRLVEFHDIDTHTIHFQRMTEVTFPPRTIDLGGFACGLKFGFSF